MKVGMYYTNRDVRVEEQDVPGVGDDDVLISVGASGICGSDTLEWYRSKHAPLVLGHEVAGEIVQVGKNVGQFQEGDRVFATHHVPCDECKYCLSGHGTACPMFQEKNNFTPGGFAQLLRVTGRSVRTGILKLPPDMSYETAAFIEPLGTVVRAMRAVGLTPGESLMIYGGGIVGILFMKLAKALGAGTVTVADVNEYRLERAKAAGADFAVDTNQNVAELMARNDGYPADKVAICTDALSAAEAALRSVDRGGTVLFFAVGRPGESLAVDFNQFWRNDVSLRTCYGAAPIDNRQALELLRSGVVKVSDMITHRYSLDEIGAAFARAADPTGALKVIIEPNR